jgi:hypothetical protein
MVSNFYLAKDSPKYKLRHTLEIGFVTMGLIAVDTLAFNYKKNQLGKGENDRTSRTSKILPWRSNHNIQGN